MALAKLTVDLTLGLAKFEADAGKTATAAYKLGERIGDGLKVGAQAVATLGVAMTGAAAGAIAFADRSAKAVAEFADLAERSGAAASAIASFQTAADVSGTRLDKVADIMVKLNAMLSKPLDATKGPGAALAALGLDAEKLRQLAPDERIEEVARAFDGYATGAGKSAAAVALLGKSGAEALPFLGDLVEVGRSQIKLTDEQIALADTYSKAQARSRSELQQLAQAAALQALPAMNAFTEALRDTAEAVVGVDSATKTLGRSTAVADFSESAVKALGFVVDAGDGVIRTFGLVGKTIGGYAAVAGALLRGELQQARDAGAAFREDAAALLDAPLFSDRLAARLAQSKLPRAVEPDKPQLAFRIADPSKAKAAVKESTGAYDTLIRSITEKTSAAEAELAGTAKLTESQRFALDVVTKLAAAEGKYTEAQKQAATAALEAYLPAAQAVELREQQAKAAEALAKATADATAALDRETVARVDANRAMAEALEEYGLTGEQIDRLRIVRLQHALAIEEEALAVGRARDLSDAEAATMEKNIALLRQQIALRGAYAAQLEADLTDPATGAARGLQAYTELAKNAGLATRDAVAGSIAALEDDLTRSLSTGRFSVRGFVDTVISEVNRLYVVRPLLASIFGSGTAQSGIGWLAGLLQGSGGAISGIAGNDVALAFHSGGIVGQAGQPRALHAGAFLGARRYHGGGIPGLMAGEVPAVLMGGPRGRREEVLTASDPRHTDNGGRSRGFVINNHFSITGPTDYRSQEQIAAAAGRAIQRAMRRFE